MLSNRVRKQIFAEDNRTIVLKLKTKESYSLARSSTPVQPILDHNAFVEIAVGLLDRVELPAEQLYRVIIRHDLSESVLHVEYEIAKEMRGSINVLLNCHANSMGYMPNLLNNLLD